MKYKIVNPGGDGGPADPVPVKVEAGDPVDARDMPREMLEQLVGKPLADALADGASDDEVAQTYRVLRGPP